VKTVRIDRLVASTAVGMVLLLASQTGYAQQPQPQASGPQAAAAVPMPDLTLPAPPTAKDIGPASTDAAPAAPKQDAAAPSPEPAKTAAAPAPSPTGDAAVADSLRQLITSKLDRFVSRKQDRAGIETYYKTHDYKPLWVTDGAANARAKAAVAYLGQVETVGLDSADYATPDFSSAATADTLAEDELKLTATILTYARQAQIGRIHFTRVASDIDFNLVPPEPADVLNKLAGDGDTAAALDSYNPPQPEFKALKAKLAELRAGKTDEKPAAEKPKLVRVPDGPILRPGMKDQRVIALRKRLNVPGDKDNQLYDKDVFEAVKAFQLKADIGADGMLGPGTLRVMNGDTQEGHKEPVNKIDTIIVNMERWRWMPRDLGATRVVVNVPDYTLSLYRDNELYWKTKIVAGKPGKATPMTTADMKYITVNPTWNVPPSIIENEYLPALQQDPDALDRIGLKIKQDPDGTVHIYQPPGAENALGRIRFNFPNKFLVYQHDTPDKYLFSKEKRAYSHGCMRVQNPLTYATKLLSIELPNENYTEAKIEHMFGGNEININFPKPIPVHLTYQTAFVDADGKLQFREDVYSRDQRMIAILHNKSEMKVADIAIERAPNFSAKPVKLPPGTYGDRSYASGGNFFDWLFGGGPPAPRPRGNIGPRATNNGHYTYR